jgi:hypothetical protein
MKAFLNSVYPLDKTKFDGVTADQVYQFVVEFVQQCQFNHGNHDEAGAEAHCKVLSDFVSGSTHASANIKTRIEAMTATVVSICRAPHPSSWTTPNEDTILKALGDCVYDSVWSSVAFGSDTIDLSVLVAIQEYAKGGNRKLLTDLCDANPSFNNIWDVLYKQPPPPPPPPKTKTKSKTKRSDSAGAGAGAGAAGPSKRPRRNAAVRGMEKIKSCFTDDSGDEEDDAEEEASSDSD